jgi:hypothetical protein
MYPAILPESMATPDPFAGDDVAERIQRRAMQTVINPYHARDFCPILAGDDPRIAEYETALDNLASFIAGINRVVLTGGLAIPVSVLARHPETTPRFYRKHNALHLGVARSQFPSLVQRLHRYNYYPFARTKMVPIKNEARIKFAKKDEYYSLSWNEIERMSRGERLGRIFSFYPKTKNLRFIKIESGTGEIAPHEKLEDYIDVYFHYYHKGRLCSNDDKTRNCHGYFSGETYTTRSGFLLHLVNISYLQQIKRERFKKKKGKTDRHDLERIAALLAE